VNERIRTAFQTIDAKNVDPKNKINKTRFFNEKLQKS